jgi:hypothetical protein
MLNLTFDELKKYDNLDFIRLKNKEISIKWYITKKCLNNSQMEDYLRFPPLKWFDDVYTWMVEKECTWKYKFYYRWKDISFIVSRKFFEKYVYTLERFNYWYRNIDWIIFIWDSLKFLLEENGYIDYEWRIKIYWVFRSINTTKKNIWKIWKAEILDENDNVLDVVEDKIK